MYFVPGTFIAHCLPPTAESWIFWHQMEAASDSRAMLIWPLSSPALNGKCKSIPDKSKWICDKTGWVYRIFFSFQLHYHKLLKSQSRNNDPFVFNITRLHIYQKYTLIVLTDPMTLYCPVGSQVSCQKSPGYLNENSQTCLSFAESSLQRALLRAILSAQTMRTV